jgi:hypothetical protein
LVSTTWEEFGWAAPTHAAWQLTSVTSHLRRQLAVGGRAGLVVVGATLWGTAQTAEIRALTKMAEYFILMVW